MYGLRLFVRTNIEFESYFCVLFFYYTNLFTWLYEYVFCLRLSPKTTPEHTVTDQAEKFASM